jgi:hypothetical protein
VSGGRATRAPAIGQQRVEFVVGLGSCDPRKDIGEVLGRLDSVRDAVADEQVPQTLPSLYFLALFLVSGTEMNRRHEDFQSSCRSAPLVETWPNSLRRGTDHNR